MVRQMSSNARYRLPPKNVLFLRRSPSGRPGASDDETYSVGTLRHQARLLEKFRGPGSNQSRRRSGAAKVTFGAVAARGVVATDRGSRAAQKELSGPHRGQGPRRPSKALQEGPPRERKIKYTRWYVEYAE